MTFFTFNLLYITMNPLITYKMPLKHVLSIENAPDSGLCH